MHSPTTGILAGMVDKLAIQAILPDEDRAALLQLPYTLRTFEPGSYLVREGDITTNCAILVVGFAYKHKTSRSGGRQIVGIQFPGEILNLQQLHINVADHNVQTLTECKIAEISHRELRKIARDRQSICNALTISAFIEGSITREWLLNIGQRDARTRIAHFLCEFAVRENHRNKVLEKSFQLPLSQEQLGDALGLTAVHINRTLKTLEEEGLIFREKRAITFLDWNRLRDISEFNSRYLHYNH